MKRWFAGFLVFFCVAFAVPTNLENLQVVQSFSFPGHNGYGTFELSEDGRTAATWYGQQLLLWDTTTGEVKREILTKIPIETLAFVNNNTLRFLEKAVFKDQQKNVTEEYHLLEMTLDGEPKSLPFADIDSTATNMSFLNHGQTIISWPYNPDYVLVKLELLSVAPYKKRAINVSGRLNTYALSEDQKHLVVVIDNITKVFNTSSGVLETQIKDVFGVPKEVAISGNGERIALLFPAVGKISIWQNQQKIAVLRQYKVLKNVNNNSGYFKHEIAFSSDQTQLLWNVGFDETLFGSKLQFSRWSIATEQQLSVQEFPMDYAATCHSNFSKIQHWLCRDQSGGFRTTNEQGQVQDFNSFSIQTSSLSPDGSRLAVLGYNRQIRVFQTSDAREINRFSVQEVSSLVSKNTLEWSDNNRWLNFGGNTLWDANTGDLLYQRSLIGDYHTHNNQILVTDIDVDGHLIILPLQETTLPDNATDDQIQQAIDALRNQARKIGKAADSTNWTDSTTWAIANNLEIAVQYSDKVARAYSITSGKELWHLLLNDPQNTAQFVFSVDNQFVLLKTDTSMQLLEASTGKTKKFVHINQTTNQAMSKLKSLSPNNQYAIFSSSLVALEKDVLEVKLPPSIQEEFLDKRFDFSRDGRYLIEVTETNTIQFWATPTRTVVF